MSEGGAHLSLVWFGVFQRAREPSEPRAVRHASFPIRAKTPNSPVDNGKPHCHFARVQTHRSLIAGCALAACVFSADRAEAAQQLALDFATAFDRAPVANSNYGWAFTVTSPIVVDGLGFWDAGSDGLVEKHEVGLWLASVAVPVLIASADVSNNDSIRVPSISSNGRWLFSSISPITLAPG